MPTLGSFPTLYSLNTNGSVQQWTISTKGNRIVKEYGQVGGRIQIVEDIISEGKNIGKVNETSAQQQADLEAKAQWTKKLKSGYAQNLSDAMKGKVDKNYVAGGIEPMLAHKWRDHASKIDFPAYVQPKLDGIRCIAIIKDGKCTLWSRTRKPIVSMPHIVEEVERVFSKHGDLILDGELYNHSYKNKFEEIVSLVRPETPRPGHEVVQYHVYDIVVKNSPFEDRSNQLGKYIKASCKYIIRVQTEKVNEEDVTGYFTEFLKEGYEGAMIRNATSLYEYKRSYNLQKIKQFDDAEFEVVGVVAGRGRMSECAIFCCVTKKGDNFNCKMEGSLENLAKYLKNPKLVVGKMLTVRYQGTTNGSVPRFPIGVSIRDYE